MWEVQPLCLLFSVPATRLPVYAYAAEMPWEGSGRASRSAAPIAAPKGAPPLLPRARQAEVRSPAYPRRSLGSRAEARSMGFAVSAIGVSPKALADLGSRSPSSTPTTAGGGVLRRRAAILSRASPWRGARDPFLSGGTQPASTGSARSCAKPGRGAIAARASSCADASRAIAEKCMQVFGDTCLTGLQFSASAAAGAPTSSRSAGQLRRAVWHKRRRDRYYHGRHPTL